MAQTPLLAPTPRCDWGATSLLPAAGLPLAAVGGAPLQRDPQDAVAQPHEERSRAVQDAQAAQGLVAPGRQHVQLLQITASEAEVRGGQRLQDGA